MPRFQYKAINKSSHPISGVIVSENEFAVEQRLAETGLFVLDVVLDSSGRSKARVKITRREMVDLFNGLSAMLEAGIDLSQCLNILVEETKREELKNVLSDIRINIESGVPLDEAMAFHPKLFEPEVCNLIRAGSYSGNLVEACSDVAAHVEWVDHLMADVRQATVYPIIVILAVLSLVMLMFLFVVPQFAQIFNALDLELPGITLAVISIGEFTVHYWWLILLIAVATTIALRILPERYLWIGLKLDRIKLNLPLFGPLILLLSQSRFSHNLSLMLRAGVPIVDALSLLIGVVGNRVVAQAVHDAKLSVTEGQKMSDGLAPHGDIFTPLVMRMIVIGEESGKLDHCLAMISKRLDSEIPRRIKRLFSVLEPIIIVSLIGVIGLIAAAIFMPLFDLMGGIIG